MVLIFLKEIVFCACVDCAMNGLTELSIGAIGCWDWQTHHQLNLAFLIDMFSNVNERAMEAQWPAKFWQKHLQTNLLTD